MTNDYSNHLKELFAELDDLSLIERKNSGTLTDEAKRLIEIEIQKRGITEEIELNLMKAEENKLKIENDKIERYPSPLDRAVAHLIDQIALIPIGLIFAFLFRLIPTDSDQLSNLWVFPCILYFLFSDALPKGQSIGKKILKISVVDFNSRIPSGLFQSFIRNVVLLFLGFIDVFFIFSSNRRRLGDLAAGTIVIFKK
jgi:uncharacterized RDD family membrane protein YckC